MATAAPVGANRPSDRGRERNDSIGDIQDITAAAIVSRPPHPDVPREFNLVELSYADGIRPSHIHTRGSAVAKEESTDKRPFDPGHLDSETARLVCAMHDKIEHYGARRADHNTLKSPIG